MVWYSSESVQLVNANKSTPYQASLPMSFPPVTFFSRKALPKNLKFALMQQNYLTLFTKMFFLSDLMIWPIIWAKTAPKLHK